ncbi:MAG: respiratory nitrate reductase subunit gamma [Magnetococcales bacterium]|nr:respiratory nitrate reductase subunit gamma [Magnetococcales bacterium]
MLSTVAYIVVLIALVGFIWRIITYARTPAPLKIPTTPAPVTALGVRLRMFTEVAFFNSLFKGNKWTWLGGYAFHLALLLVTIRHFRYFVDPLPPIFAHFQIIGIIAGIGMVAALGFLLVRRWWVDRTRFISSAADYAILLLLLGIGVTGLLMKFVVRPDIVEIKHAMIGWVTLQGFPTPSDALFVIHFILVLMLILIFPFSKLMHMGGIFFSPTRNQIDNPREKKHVNPWSKY